MGIIFILLILIGFGFLGRLVFLSVFDMIFKPEKQKPTYIDNSVHYHRHLTVINKDKAPITIEDERITTDV